MGVWLLVSAVCVMTFGLTWLLLRYAKVLNLIDVPNLRSSHSIPKARGGGVAIALTFLTSLVLLIPVPAFDNAVLIALLGAGSVVAGLGLLDDFMDVSIRWRLLGHFSAAAWALYWLEGLPPLLLLGVAVDLGVLGNLLAAVYLVWLLNLYNFMDGIDGIASVEALCVCFGGALLYVLLGAESLALMPLLLAAAVAGFLCWNFPPARMFMGDAGSGFLGLVLGVLSLQAAWFTAELLWSWVILLGVFVVDATFTLLRRLLRGDKVYQAHRSHAYQYASRRFAGHRPVTLAVLLINLLWLLPMALLAGLGYVDGLLATLIAYLPLLWLAVKFKAGQLEQAEG